MREEILRIENVRTIQKNITYLDNFNLSVLKGDVMGLLVANAHGINALMALLRQNGQLHYGRIEFLEKVVNNYIHSDYSMNAITIIEKQGKLINDLSVADNIFVLRQGYKNYIINTKQLEQELSRYIREVCLEIDGSMLISTLNQYEKYVVELIKAVVLGRKLIVIKDISSTINSQELEKFQRLIDKYKKKGITFIYICSHHEEAFKICTSMAVFDKGKIRKVFEKHEFYRENLESLYEDTYKDLEISEIGKEEKEILSFYKCKIGKIKNLTLCVKKGECVTIFDKDGMVIQDILKVLTGESKNTQGSIYYKNKIFYSKNIRHSLKQGICIIDEEVKGKMLFSELNYLDNLCFLLYNKLPSHFCSKIKKMVLKEQRALLGDVILEQDIRNLSGEEIISLIYKRVYLCMPKIVICVQPFFGADMQLRRHIISQLENFKKQGISIIILSINLSDSLIISDNLFIMSNGKIFKKYSRAEFHKLNEEATILY